MILCGIYPFYFLQPYWGIVYIPYSPPILIVQFDDFETVYVDVQPSPQSSFGTFSWFQRVPSCLLQSISILFSCPRRWSPFFLCNFGFSRHFTYKWTHTGNNFYIGLPSLSIMFLRFILIAWIINFFLFLVTTLCSSLHQLMDIWVVYRFWLLWFLLLWSFAYKWHVFSFL